MEAQVYKVAGRFPLGDLQERRPLGDLYKGTDDQSGQPVSIFLVSPHVVQSTMHRDQILRELQQQSTISSPRFPGLIDKGLIEDGRIFVTTAAITEGTLSSVIGSAGALPVERAVAVIGQVAEALQELQGAGLLHRELSPSHVLLGAGDQVQVVNFCVAESLGNSVFGDPWFMSPEQAAGRPVDLRANIYSLGALLYYAVTGTPPFQDAEPGTLVERHKSAEVEPPTTRRADLNLQPQVDAFVAKAMAKSALSRHFSLDQFIQELAAVTAPGAAPAEPSVAAGASTSPVGPGPAPPESEAMAATMLAGSGGAPPSPIPEPSGPPAEEPPPPPPPAAEGPAPTAVEPAGEPAQPAPAAPERTARPGRRRGRKKGGFRVTMWFMKGEQMQEEAAAEDEEELDKVTVGSGEIADKDKGIDERYLDDGSLNAQDKAAFSLRTGQTGMLPAVQIPEGGLVPGGAIDEKGVVGTIDQSRRAWLWLGIVGVVVGAAVLVFFLWRSTIPLRFIHPGLHSDLKEKVPDFKAPLPKINMPAEETYPEGKVADLWAKYRPMAAKKELRDPEKVVPEKGHGAGHYLVALEKKKKLVDAAAKKKKRRRKPPGFFARIAGRKPTAKAIKAVAKEYKDKKSAVEAALTAIVFKLKGKVYEGENTPVWVRAMRAGKILLALPGDFKDKKKVSSTVSRITRFFKKPPPPPKPADPAKAMFDKLKVGMTLDEAKKILACASVTPVTGGKKAKTHQVLCKGKAEGKKPVMEATLTVDSKSKKLTEFKMKMGDKTYEFPKTPEPARPATRPGARADARPDPMAARAGARARARARTRARTRARARARSRGRRRRRAR